MMPYFSLQKIGPFYTWGIFLALGFITPFIFVLRKAEKEGIAKEKIWAIFLWIIVGSIIGMRLGYVFQFPKEFFLNPIGILKIWDGGLTFYGGLIGGIIGAFFCRTYDKKLSSGNSNFWQIADLIALYFPLGIVIARIGCFLINDHQGAITRLPWGIVWPDGSVRHPVALYLIINALVIFLILSLSKDKLRNSGFLFYYFLAIYSFTRFFLDFARSKDTPFSDPSFYVLSISQWISLFVFVFSLGFFLKKKRLTDGIKIGKLSLDSKK